MTPAERPQIALTRNADGKPAAVFAVQYEDGPREVRLTVEQWFAMTADLSAALRDRPLPGETSLLRMNVLIVAKEGESAREAILRSISELDRAMMHRFATEAW